MDSATKNTPARFKQIEELYYKALDQDVTTLREFLKQACADDLELQFEVESLLMAREPAKNFLLLPALEILSPQKSELVDRQDQDSSPEQRTLVGQIINQYEIIAPLGKGGMGEVYLAEDTRLHRKIAMKFLPQQFTQDASRVKRFEQEARVISSLNHPHIVTLFDLGQSGSHYFMATEFIAGQTLRSRLQETPRLPVHEAIAIVLQIAEALQAAHLAGVVHRDIKPENIIIRDDEHVKILDFGLAKLIEGITGKIKNGGAKEQDAGAKIIENDPFGLSSLHLSGVSSSSTLPGLIMGTLIYMSPEQAQAAQIDSRADIFSLGVVFYEMLAGRTPFQGATASDLINAILHSEPIPLPELAIPSFREINRISFKSLAKDPADRYQTMTEFIQDLKNLSHELIYQTRLTDVRSRLSNSTSKITLKALPSGETNRKNQKVLRLKSLLIVSSFILTIFTGWQFLSHRESASIKSLAVLPFKQLSEDPDTQHLGIGIADTLINRLSTLRQIQVRPTNSILPYADPNQDVLAAGREQKVEAVLEGNIQRVDHRLRITTRLLRVHDGATLWNGMYDLEWNNILSLQDEISTAVVKALSLQLSFIEKTKLTKRYTSNNEAYNQYLKGEYLFTQVDTSSIAKAEVYFQRAITEDPSFAMAYIKLAKCYSMQGIFNDLIPREAWAKTRAIISKAIEIDPTIPDSYVTLGIGEIDRTKAKQFFIHAIELDPENYDALLGYSHYCMQDGQFAEAQEKLAILIKNDPLSFIAKSSLGLSYYYQHKYDQAADQFHQILDLNPNYLSARVNLGNVLVQQGKYQEAIAEYKQANGLIWDQDNDDQVAYALALAGQKGQARRILNHLKDLSLKRYVSPFDLARLSISLGEKEQALKYLERAIDDEVYELHLLKALPVFDELHSEPRFLALLRRLKFIP